MNQSYIPSFNVKKKQGFKKVRNVGGGYQAWVDHNFPIIKEQQQSAN